MRDSVNVMLPPIAARVLLGKTASPVPQIPEHSLRLPFIQHVLTTRERESMRRWQQTRPRETIVSEQ